MKIVIVNQHQSDALGGSELQCDIIGRELHRRGHDVVYYALNALPETQYHVPYRLVPVPRTPRTIRSVPARVIDGMLKQEQPHVVYWRFEKKSLLRAGLLCRRHDARLVFGTSSVQDTTRWLDIPLRKPSPRLRGAVGYTRKAVRWQLKSRLNYEAYRWVDGVVVLRQSLVDNLQPFQDRLRITSIYDSVVPTDPAPFQWARPYVAWVANMKPIKNPDLFVEAVRRLGREDVDFLMVGRVDDPRYQFIADGEGLPANLHYLGPRTPAEVDAILKGSLFLAHTCDEEGFGNNFIQAWLQARPTVTLYFDPDDLMKRNGIGLHAGSLDGFCADLGRLLDDAPLRASMGTKAKAFALEHFHPEKNTARLEAFFESVCRG